MVRATRTGLPARTSRWSRGSSAPAQAFVAMTSELPLPPGPFARGRRLEELRRCAGTQFDADVVETLITVRNEHAVDLAIVA